jgi:hypothetical protein
MRKGGLVSRPNSNVLRTFKNGFPENFLRSFMETLSFNCQFCWLGQISVFFLFRRPRMSVQIERGEEDLYCFNSHLFKFLKASLIFSQLYIIFSVVLLIEVFQGG